MSDNKEFQLLLDHKDEFDKIGFTILSKGFILDGMHSVYNRDNGYNVVLYYRDLEKVIFFPFIYKIIGNELYVIEEKSYLKEAREKFHNLLDKIKLKDKLDNSLVEKDNNKGVNKL